MKRSLTVPGLSLDDFVYQQGNPAPHVVKMDIEGGEVMALPGMQRILQESHPLMLLELHGPESAQAAHDILTGAGYCLCSMAPGYPDVPAGETLDWKASLSPDERASAYIRGPYSDPATRAAGVSRPAHGYAGGKLYRWSECVCGRSIA